MAFNSSALKTTLAAPLLVAAFAANAQTVSDFEPGQCYDQSAVLKALTDNGQLQVFTGNRITDNEPFNIITLNESGYGFNFEQNKVTGKPSELCLRVAFKTAILEIGNTKPSWAGVIRPNTGIDVNKIYQNNGKLWLAAQSYTKNTQGAEIGGKSIALASTEPKDRLASVWEVNSQGVPTTSFAMKHFKPQEHNIKFLVERGLGSIAPSITNGPNPKN